MREANSNGDLSVSVGWEGKTKMPSNHGSTLSGGKVGGAKSMQMARPAAKVTIGDHTFSLVLGGGDRSFLPIECNGR